MGVVEEKAEVGAGEGGEEVEREGGAAGQRGSKSKARLQ
jgi:hypothetical protein